MGIFKFSTGPGPRLLPKVKNPVKKGGSLFPFKNRGDSSLNFQRGPRFFYLGQKSR